MMSEGRGQNASVAKTVEFKLKILRFYSKTRIQIVLAEPCKIFGAGFYLLMRKKWRLTKTGFGMQIQQNRTEWAVHTP
jgi:hypothetical protein